MNTRRAVFIGWCVFASLVALWYFLGADEEEEPDDPTPAPTQPPVARLAPTVFKAAPLQAFTIRKKSGTATLMALRVMILSDQTLQPSVTRDTATGWELKVYDLPKALMAEINNLGSRPDGRQHNILSVDQLMFKDMTSRAMRTYVENHIRDFERYQFVVVVVGFNDLLIALDKTDVTATADNIRAIHTALMPITNSIVTTIYDANYSYAALHYGSMYEKDYCDIRHQFLFEEKRSSINEYLNYFASVNGYIFWDMHQATRHSRSELRQWSDCTHLSKGGTAMVARSLVIMIESCISFYELMLQKNGKAP